MNKHATENFVRANTIIHLGEIESIQTVFNEDKFRHSGIYSYTLTSVNGAKSTQLAIINGTYEKPVQYFINLDNGLIAQRNWLNGDECWADEFHGVDIWELPQFLCSGYQLGNYTFTSEIYEQIQSNTNDISGIFDSVDRENEKIGYIESFLAKDFVFTTHYTGTQTTENILLFGEYTPQLAIVTSDNDEKCLPLILTCDKDYAYMYEISSSGALIPHKIDVMFGPLEIYLTSYDDNGYACMNGSGTYTCTAVCHLV